MHRIPLFDASTKLCSLPGPFAFHHVIANVVSVNCSSILSCCCPISDATINEEKPVILSSIFPFFFVCFSINFALIKYWIVLYSCYLADVIVPVEV